MALLNGHRVALIFGILGNVVSLFVYLAPLPTFYRIFKKKSTEGFQSIPYSVALFSAMLMLYYASLKKEKDAYILVTINSIGCVIESICLTFYMIYATRSSRVLPIYLYHEVAYLVQHGGLGIDCSIGAHDSLRVHVVGWICAVFSVSVFAAPLSIIRLVIRTKSVEYMPFSLSFCLTMGAIFWLAYGIAVTDYYVAAPNVLGFLFGSTQMTLFFIYKNRRSDILLETQPPEEELVAETAKERKDEPREPSDSNESEETEMNEGMRGTADKPEQPGELNV